MDHRVSGVGAYSVMITFSFSFSFSVLFPFSFPFLSFFSFQVYLFLSLSQSYKEKESSFICWFTPLNGCNNQTWVDAKPGASGYSKWVQGPKDWTITCCLSGCKQLAGLELERPGHKLELMRCWLAGGGCHVPCHCTGPGITFVLKADLCSFYLISLLHNLPLQITYKTIPNVRTIWRLLYIPILNTKHIICLLQMKKNEVAYLCQVDYSWNSDLGSLIF